MPELEQTEIEPSDIDVKNAFSQVKNFGTLLKKMLDENYTSLTKSKTSNAQGLFSILKNNIEKA
jgi:uncharacterized protein YfeS